MADNKSETKEIKQEHTEERGKGFTPYYIDLGTFQDVTEGAYKNSQEGKTQNPFKWKVIEEYDNFEDAFKGYKAYVGKQMTYDREDLVKIWANGRIDVRLRHGPKMLDWCGMYTRSSVKSDEEDAKQIKGKDPIEAQEEDSADVPSTGDAFDRVFIRDDVDDKVESISNRLKSELETHIYNSSASVEVSDVKLKERFNREFFHGKLSAELIVKGSTKKNVIPRLVREVFDSIREVDGVITTLILTGIEAQEIYKGQEDIYTVKYVISGTVNGHEDMNANRTNEGSVKPMEQIAKEDHAKILSMSNQLEQLGIEELRKRASSALQNASGKIAEGIRSRFSRALKEVEIAKESEDAKVRDDYLERAYMDFVHIIILSEITKEQRPGEPLVGGDLSAKHGSKMTEEERLAMINREISNEIRGRQKSHKPKNYKPDENAGEYDKFEMKYDLGSMTQLNGITDIAIDEYARAKGLSKLTTIDNPISVRRYPMKKIENKETKEVHWEVIPNTEPIGNTVEVVYDASKYKGLTIRGIEVPEELKQKLTERLKEHIDEWFFLRVEKSNVTNKLVLKPTVFSINNIDYKLSSSGGSSTGEALGKKDPYAGSMKSTRSAKQEQAEYERYQQAREAERANRTPRTIINPKYKSHIASTAEREERAMQEAAGNLKNMGK